MSKKNITGAGGGGCFPAGVKVNTPSGYVSIEDIKVGDLVYAFDLSSYEPGETELPGRIFIAEVENTFKHSFGEVGYTSPLLVITHEKGVLNVTGNHHILTSSRQSEGADQSFARADELQVGDTLFTEYGDEVKIVSIEAGAEYDFVYNLEVKGLHTYIADKIRVHNGGGGKGGGHTATQAPNSIRTNQIARVLNLISEGECVGLWDSVNPAKSVFFDNSPLQNADGTYNFTNVTVDQRFGLPSQTYIPGFSAVESEHVVSQLITTAAPVVKGISASTVTAARVTIKFPNGLQSISASNGDANGTSVQFRISTRVSAGTWSVVTTQTVKEMSSGPFEVNYRIPRPTTAGTWEFKVERLTADSTSNYLINAINLESYTEITDVQLTYDNRALVGLAVGADSTNNRIPTMSFDFGGVKVQIPDNYNPTTRVYTGTWSGTFASTRAWTDNPVWCLYDLITNTRYGLGSKIDVSLIDKFSFYNAAVYCDELVNDGKGTGTYEPRFVFNADLMEREDAWKVMQSIASSFNASLYMQNGVIRLSQDRPTSATRIITNSNVLGGTFTYTSADSRSQFTAVNVTYNNPSDNFLPTTVTEVADSSYITRYGYQSTDIVAFGCTSEGQARRAAKWVLDTNLNNADFVEFAVAMEHADFEPGEVFKVMDRDYSQVSQEGRIVNISGSTITLDQAVTIAGGTWTIDIATPSGTIETRNITTTSGTTSTITISGTTSGTTGSVYLITGAVSPRLFKALSLLESQPGTYQVKGVFYDPNKFARVESGITLPSPVYWTQPKLVAVNTPTSLVISPQTTTTPEGFIQRQLAVSWTPPADGTAATYKVTWAKDGQPVDVIDGLVIPFCRIDASISGTYDFYVVAINQAGVASPTLSGSYSLDVNNGSGSAIGAPTGLGLVGGGTTFGTGTMALTWTAPTPVVGTTLKDYQIDLAPSPSGAAFRTIFTTDTFYNYTQEMNAADNGGFPRSAIKATVRARDTLNKTGSSVTGTFSSVAGAGITSLQVRGGGTTFSTLDLEVTWNSTTSGGQPFTSDPTFDYFLVEVLNGSTVVRSEKVKTASYIYSFQNNVKDNGQNTPLNSIGIRVTSYNTFGVAGSNASNTFTPATPPNITSVYVAGTTGTTFAEADLNITWANNDGAGQPYSASNVFQYYLVEVMNGTTVQRSRTTLDKSFSYTLDMNSQDNATSPTRTPTIRVRAVNVYNVQGTAVSTSFSNPTPAVPSNLQVNGGLGTLQVSFDLPTDPDYRGAYVWASTTSGFTPSSSKLIATTASGYASVSGLTNNTTYYVKVAAFDSFAKSTSGTGMNVSTQMSASTAAAPGLPSYSTAPGSPATGDTYINTTDGKLYRWSGSAWVAVVGDILANSVTTAKLAAGAVTTNELAAGSVTAGKIVSNTITSTQIAAGTITADRLAAGTITAASGVIGTAAIDTLQLKNGSISDTRFFVSNTSTTLASTSTTGTYTISPTVVAELAITTPNPTGISGPFSVYLHSQLLCNTRVNGGISVSNRGTTTTGDLTNSSNLSILGMPTWKLQVIRASDNAVMATTDVVLNGSGVQVGQLQVYNGGSASGGSITNTTNISIAGGSGSNLLFLSTSLAANTSYKIQLIVNGSLVVNTNTTSTPVSVTADQRAIYYQCVLR